MCCRYNAKPQLVTPQLEGKSRVDLWEEDLGELEQALEDMDKEHLKRVAKSTQVGFILLKYYVVLVLVSEINVCGTDSVISFIQL